MIEIKRERGSVVGMVGFALLLIPPLLLGGSGGCGGGASGGDTGDTGVTVSSIDEIPSLNIEDYVDTGSNSSGLMADLKGQTTTGNDVFCTEFCYMKQMLLEAIRHSKEVEFFLCMSRKAKDVSGGVFDFPTGNGCNYFTVTPPEGVEREGPPGGGPPADEPGGGSSTSRLEAGVGTDLRMRLCTDGTTHTFHMCEGGELHQEIRITNNSDGSIGATATNSFSFGDCDDRGQLEITSTCNVEDFSNPDCAASFNAAFNGCFGSGAINFAVTGGTSRRHTLEANFSNGGEGATTFGSFELCTYGDWTAGANGCFKAESSGSFPAIPAAEVSFLSSSENGGMPGCGDEVVNASSLCPNDNFDPESFNSAIPVCPFVATTEETCPLDFSNVECCSISGATVSEQTGTQIDSSEEAADLFTEVTNHACPEQASEVSFVEEWDCQAEGTFTDVDMSGATSADFEECAELFTDLAATSAESNCQQQSFSEGGESVAQSYTSSSECTSDSDCSGGQVCMTSNDGSGEGLCVTPPSSCTSDTDCVADCPEGVTSCACESHPIYGNICVQEFSCTSDSQCPQGSTCNTGTGKCEFQQQSGCTDAPTCTTTEECQNIAASTSTQPIPPELLAAITCTDGCCEMAGGGPQ